jgi:hypothetical protein
MVSSPGLSRPPYLTPSLERGRPARTSTATQCRLLVRCGRDARAPREREGRGSTVPDYRDGRDKPGQAPP